MNVTGVWSQGITGKDIVVAILDDGLQMDHPDLKDNYASIHRVSILHMYAYCPI